MGVEASSGEPISHSRPCPKPNPPRKIAFSTPPPSVPPPPALPAIEVPAERSEGETVPIDLSEDTQVPTDLAERPVQEYLEEAPSQIPSASSTGPQPDGPVTVQQHREEPRERSCSRDPDPDSSTAAVIFGSRDAGSFFFGTPKTNTA